MLELKAAAPLYLGSRPLCLKARLSLVIALEDEEEVLMSAR